MTVLSVVSKKRSCASAQRPRDIDSGFPQFDEYAGAEKAAKEMQVLTLASLGAGGAVS